MAMGKPPDRHSPASSLHQVQTTYSRWTLLTGKNGPPERNRTGSPLWSRGVASLCIAVFDCAGSARAGTAHGAIATSPHCFLPPLNLQGRNPTIPTDLRLDSGWATEEAIE